MQAIILVILVMFTDGRIESDRWEYTSMEKCLETQQEMNGWADDNQDIFAYSIQCIEE